MLRKQLVHLGVANRIDHRQRVPVSSYDARWIRLLLLLLERGEYTRHDH
jgi:hypothetical protein